ncbi:mitochondrial carrier domain-containing protein [Hysterangium stoloniferum]|nr:mitochondrial carrier domain-containing protein [Hysterangium stoloniferum]
MSEVLGAIATPSTINELIAGSVAGAAQVLVGQPLDTVKTRAQIAPAGMFKGPMDILMRTIRQEGFFALYKGMASPLVGIAGVNSLLFTAYSVSRRIVSPFPDLSLRQTALAGSMAGAVNSILASPVELLKVKMQGQYGGANDRRLSRVAIDLYRSSGFRHGIMRGFWVTVAREIPAYAGFYTGFEYAKRRFRKSLGGPLPSWALLASGSFGGICYWMACYPLDVAKSRVQLSDRPLRRGLGYIWTELSDVVREQGFKGLYRGLSPSREPPLVHSYYALNITRIAVIRSVPAAAVTFFTFERTRGKPTS